LKIETSVYSKSNIFITTLLCENKSIKTNFIENIFSFPSWFYFSSNCMIHLLQNAAKWRFSSFKFKMKYERERERERKREREKEREMIFPTYTHI